MKIVTDIKDNQIIIDHTKTPWIIRVILTLILSICALIPLAVTFFVLSQGDGPHISIFISYLIFWGLGFYLVRVVLWNTFGKEIISLDQNRVTYIADYKYFKDGKKELNSHGLQTEIIYEDTMDIHVGRLRIFNQTEEIETVLQSSLSDLEKMKERIKTRYNISC